MKSKFSIEELARIVSDLQVRVRALEIGQQQSRHDNPDKSYWQNPTGIIPHRNQLADNQLADSYGDVHQPFYDGLCKDVNQIK